MIKMRRLVLCLVLATAAASVGLASSTVDGLVAQMPQCAVKCSLETAAADGCGATDYRCMCLPSKTDPNGINTAKCLRGECSVSEMNST